MSRATDDLARGLNEDLRRLEAELTELKIMIGTLREARAGMRASRPPAAANDNADQTSAPADQTPSTAPTVVVRPRPSGWWPRTILECQALRSAEDPRVESSDDAPTARVAGVR